MLSTWQLFYGQGVFGRTTEIKQRVLNLQNWDGLTPLSTAVSDCKTDVSQLLLAQDGIAVNLQATCGRSTVHVECEMERGLELEQLLLHRPTILPNVQDASGQTRLHLACRCEEAVQLLLLHSKIDVDLQDARGETALSAACRWGEICVMEHLCVDTSGRTEMDRLCYTMPLLSIQVVHWKA